MNRVFVPNLSAHDHTDAERYGELVFVTKGLLPKHATSNMHRFWMEALRDSQPTDYILLTGPTTLCVIGAAIFGALHGRLNLLIWRTDRYFSREIIFNELMEGIRE